MECTDCAAPWGSVQVRRVTRRTGGARPPGWDTGPTVSGRRIDSPSNPLVKELAALRDRRARDATGSYLVEGVREEGRALEADVPVIRLVHNPDLHASSPDARAVVEQVMARSAEVVELSSQAYTKLSMRQNPDGIALHARSAPLGAASLSEVRPVPAPLVLVLDGIEKPGNLGALLRTAGAVGVDLVIVIGHGTDLFNPNVIRASQGALFAVAPLVADDDAALRFLRSIGARLVATTPAAMLPHWSVDLTGPVALLVGAEATGLRDSWLRAADAHVSIPMRTVGVDSLNASVAGAVVLYEAMRQRSTA